MKKKNWNLKKEIEIINKMLNFKDSSQKNNSNNHQKRKTKKNK